MITYEQKEKIAEILRLRSMRYYQIKSIPEWSGQTIFMGKDSSRHPLEYWVDIVEDVVMRVDEIVENANDTHSVATYLAIIFGREVEDIITESSNVVVNASIGMNPSGKITYNDEDKDRWKK